MWIPLSFTILILTGFITPPALAEGRNCSSVECVTQEQAIGNNITPLPKSEDALQLWDDNGNGRITCKEARNHGITPVPKGHPAYPYMTDRDKDGVVCER